MPPSPTDAQRRLLAAVAQRVPPERMRELYLFAPIRQGGVETGLAVIAVGEPEPAPAMRDALRDEVPDEVPDEVQDSVDACLVAAPVDLEPADDDAPGFAPVLSTDEEVVRAVVLAAEAAADQRSSADAPCDPTDAAAGPAPQTDGRATAVAPDTPAAPPARERFTVYTARYRLQLKGPDRGKWDVEIVAEADAPLLTVDAVVRGVQRRAGEVTEVDRLLAADVRRILDEGV
jgi:hypothetical protein